MMSNDIQIILINMPFSQLEYPSLGLTQIKYILNKKFNNNINIKILYLNQTFANIFGIDEYRLFDENNIGAKDIYETGYKNNGLGEWLFRQMAYPNVPDNKEEYFNTFFPHQTKLKDYVLGIREKLDDYIDNIIHKYSIYKADIVGFTSMFQQYMPSLAMARKIKKNNPNVINIIGGCNCELITIESFANQGIDYIFKGPALVNLPQMIECYINGNMNVLNNIKGILSVNQSSVSQGVYSSTVDIMGEELDINQVVYLDYSDFFKSLKKNNLLEKIEPILPFETSRGCSWGEKSKCSFCAVNGKDASFNTMNSKNAIKYFINILKNSNYCNLYRAIDSTIPPNYFYEVFPYINNLNSKKQIFYQTRVGLKQKDFKVLKKTGITVLQAGIESLSTPHLKLMNKSATSFENIAFLINAHLYSINVIWNLLVGIPHEDNNTYIYYKKILPLLAHLQPPTEILPINYTRHSSYVEQKGIYALEIEPVVELYRCLYPISDDAIKSRVYFYKLTNKDNIYDDIKREHIRNISYIVEKWKLKWKNDQPKLHFIDKKTILDTRFDKKNYYNVTKIDRNILFCLNEAKDIKELQQVLSKWEYTEIIKHIDNLLKIGLIIKEDDKYFTIVPLYND